MQGSLLQIPRNRWTIALATAAALLSFALTGFHFLAQSGWFTQEIHERLVAALEETTGGRVEIGDLDLSLFGRRLEIRQLTIHGTETPPSPPFLQVPVVRLRFGIDSLLGGQISLRELQLLDPAAHIEVAADGFTNVPKPAAAEDHQPGPDLFDLAVGLFALDRGSVYWNGTRLRYLGFGGRSACPNSIRPGSGTLRRPDPAARFVRGNRRPAAPALPRRSRRMALPGPHRNTKGSA